MIETRKSELFDTGVVPNAPYYHVSGEKEPLPLYAESLDKSFQYHSSPFVQAAYKLAVKSHRSQFRSRKEGMDKSFPYITHPVMVCKLLQLIENVLPEDYSARARLTGELSLSVALLHDVLEDDSEYLKHPKKLRKDLLDAVVEEIVLQQHQAHGETLTGDALASAKEEYFKQTQNIAEISNSVDSVFADCLALKNPSREVMGNKRAFQVEHMDEMGARASIIKMLDQTVTVLEDVLFENVRKPQSNHAFAAKALNVVKAGAENGGDAHRLAEQLFILLYNKYLDVRQSPEKQNETGAEFDIDAMLDQAKKGRIESLARKQARYEDESLAGPSREILHRGVKSIRTNAEGTEKVNWPDYGIVGVKLRADPNNSKQQQVQGVSLRMPVVLKDDMKAEATGVLADKAQNYLLAAFEGSESVRTVSLGKVRPIEGTTVREIWFENPVLLKDFEKGVKKAGEAFLQDVKGAIENADNTENVDANAVYRQAADKRNPIFSRAMQQEISNALNQSKERTI